MTAIIGLPPLRPYCVCVVTTTQRTEAHTDMASKFGSAAQLPKTIRSLALVFAFGVASLGAPSMALAVDNAPADPGVRCAAKIGPGQYEFYLPGEKVTDINGNKWVCGPDGQWFRDYSALTFVRSTFTSNTTTTLVSAAP